MHEDPTRLMGHPDGGRPHGNVRLLIAGLIAVIAGLIVAIVVIAGEGDGGETVTAPTEATTQPTTETTTDTDETTTDETTAPTTTTTAPEEEEGEIEEGEEVEGEDGSGGIEAP